MEYPMEELIPILAELTDRFTSKESTSVTRGRNPAHGSKNHDLRVRHAFPDRLSGRRRILQDPLSRPEPGSGKDTAQTDQRHGRKVGDYADHREESVVVVCLR